MNDATGSTQEKRKRGRPPKIKPESTPKLGRTPLPENDRLDVRSVRFSNREWEEIKGLAGEGGPSDFIRGAVLEEVRMIKMRKA